MNTSTSSAGALSHIRKSIKARGLWSGISLAMLLVKIRTREWFGEHSQIVTNSAMIGGLAVCVYAVYWTFSQHERIETGGEIWLITIWLAAALAGIFVTVAHFTVQPVYRRLIMMKSIQFMFFAMLVGGLGYAAFGAWADLYAKQPAEATLMALIAAVVLYGLSDVAFVFARSILVKNLAMADLNEMPSLSGEGQYRAAIHEAGHALCYGLCEGVPEDAYVVIEQDMSDLIGGRVNLPVPREPTDFTKPHIEWELMMLMAGVAAEEVIFGEGSMLGGGDMEGFNLNGTLYLMSGHGEVIAMKPETELEMVANRAAIGRLREAFREKAKAFIIANRDIIESMARDICALEYMDCEEIDKRVANVVRPEGHVLVKWPDSLAILKR